MRLPLSRHFCAEKWHLNLACRIVLYCLPVMQGFSQRLAVMVLYVISSIAPVPSLQCYPGGFELVKGISSLKVGDDSWIQALQLEIGRLELRRSDRSPSQRVPSPRGLLPSEENDEMCC